MNVRVWLLKYENKFFSVCTNSSIEEGKKQETFDVKCIAYTRKLLSFIKEIYFRISYLLIAGVKKIFLYSVNHFFSVLPLSGDSRNSVLDSNKRYRGSSYSDREYHSCLTNTGANDSRNVRYNSYSRSASESAAFLPVFIAPINQRLSLSNVSSECFGRKICILLKSAWTACFTTATLFNWFSEENKKKYGTIRRNSNNFNTRSLVSFNGGVLRDFFRSNEPSFIRRIRSYIRAPVTF